MALGFQFLAQRLEIVNLTVERQHHLPIATEHRLTSKRRQVDNGKASMAQTDPRRFIDMQPGVIRAAMV